MDRFDFIFPRILGLRWLCYCHLACCECHYKIYFNGLAYIFPPHLYADRTEKQTEKPTWEITSPIPSSDDGNFSTSALGPNPEVHYIYVCIKVSLAPIISNGLLVFALGLKSSIEFRSKRLISEHIILCFRVSRYYKENKKASNRLD